ncbi:MAG: SPOR domain-containing protein [Salibacteraceae bacterium]
MSNFTKSNSFLLTGLFYLVFVHISFLGFSQKKDKPTVFNQAMLDLSQNKVISAATAFEYLYKNDSTNMNYAYLLGQSYARLDTNLPYAIYLLEKASKKYSPDYRVRDPEERRVSEYVYYYLLMCYSLNGNCSRTIGTLNKFYSIYSFANEYYLVEGQRFHRECNKREVPIDSADLIVYEKEEKQHWVSTKSVTYTNKQPTYGVQIGATLEPKYTWEFKGVKNVEVYIDENGIYRYIIGKFVHPLVAERLLEVVKEAGYPDAFVVNVKDKTKFAEKVVNMDYKPIDDELVGSVYFTVQVGAFKSDTIPDDLAYLFMELDSIKEINDNQWTYLTVGEFDNINEARFYLELVKDVGVKDAFVTAFNYNRKVEIRQAEAYLEEQDRLRMEQQEKAAKPKKKKRKY